MRVDIQPQWHNITTWYWDTPQGQEVLNHRGQSIWAMLKEQFGVQQLYGLHHDTRHSGMWVSFPDEKMYTAFLLRWS